jgi:hypothetical protein
MDHRVTLPHTESARDTMSDDESSAGRGTARDSVLAGASRDRRRRPAPGPELSHLRARLYAQEQQSIGRAARLRNSKNVRKAWARWSSVTCPEHKTWLYAREPYSGLGAELNGWASVWQTNPRWAETAHVRHDPALRSFALGLEGHAVAVPDCSWSDLDRDFDRLAREPCCFVLARVATPEHAGMRNLVWESLEVGGNSRRIVDAHLRGYNRLQPGWIAGRISCLVIAVEVLRILEGRVPAIKLARTALEAHPAAERLVSECKALQSQNSCH